MEMIKFFVKVRAPQIKLLLGNIDTTMSLKWAGGKLCDMVSLLGTL